MNLRKPIAGTLNVLARVAICAIFLASALGNKIPHFNSVVEEMAKQGIPLPSLMLIGAIVFLIVGSVSIVLGLKAEVGASMLLVFLVLATYFFHDFWNFEGQDRTLQMIQLLKNLSLSGALVFLIINGPGPCSIESKTTANQDASIA